MWTVLQVYQLNYRAGVAQPGEEKALGKSQKTLPVPEGAQREMGEELS